MYYVLYFCTGKHVTDISSASATGIFDPFIKCWSSSMINLLKLPHDIFPQVVETSGNFGSTPKDLFGVEIPILCSVSCIIILFKKI